jgi:hypothetical protein
MFILFKFNKGKGILVLLYLIISLIGTAGIFASTFKGMDNYTIVGIAFLVAAIWTYMTRNDYYKDKEGNKIKMDTINAYFFIPMRIWAIIYSCIGLLLFGNLLFHYFE